VFFHKQGMNPLAVGADALDAVIRKSDAGMNAPTPF